MEKSLNSLELTLTNVMLTWTIAITHAFFVLFEFHETTHYKFKVNCNVFYSHKCV